MKAVCNLAATAALLVAAAPASAHFVWVSVEKDSSGQPAAHVWFSELAEPDTAELLDRIAAIQVTSRTAGGKPAAVAVTKHTQGSGGALVGAVPAGTPALSAHYKYGVITRGENTFLLQYSAKYLDAAAKDFALLSRDTSLPLDVVPQVADKGFTLQVLFQGKPAAGSEVVIFDPTAAQTDAKADEAGKLSLTAARPGLYSIRAKWVVKQAGKEGDKEYPQVNYYGTLALRVPAANSQNAAALSAADVLAKARDGRAVWNNFTGFEADLRIFAEGREQSGKITATADGQVTLAGLELKDEKAILGTLRSLVAHRLPGSSDDRGTFADDDTQHPLGRLIKLDYDSAMASAYRIKDGVIREVNRQTDGGRFTISVFEVSRNAEGKYLPAYYAVNFWNQDGSLRSSSTVHETWARVGAFDLPATHNAVFAGKGEHRNVSMTFSNYQLGK